MSLYVSFFITSNKKYNLDGSYAFHKKPPRRSKIWRKKTYFGYSGRHQVQMNFQPSPPPSPPVATPAKVSTAPMEKIKSNIEFFLYYYLYYFVFKKLLTSLLLRKDNFRK
jgi:hypothetical protein